MLDLEIFEDRQKVFHFLHNIKRKRQSPSIFPLFTSKPISKGVFYDSLVHNYNENPENNENHDIVSAQDDINHQQTSNYKNKSNQKSIGIFTQRKNI